MDKSKKSRLIEDDQQLLTGEILPLVEMTVAGSSLIVKTDEPENIIFQHSVFCQTCLPYRNPGDNVRRWERSQGRTELLIKAGEIRSSDPSHKWQEVGLPYGVKPRLILAHLNKQAVVSQSPVIEVENSLTGFVKRLLDYPPNGPVIRSFKDQLTRLAAANIQFAIGDASERRIVQADTKVIDLVDMWLEKDARQRLLWPGTIELNPRYFDSLLERAVPLDEDTIKALAHSAMGLDIYTWLAHRLHRVPPGRPQFITWKALKDQFGWNINRMDNFRRNFLTTLKLVYRHYHAARFDTNERGMTLHHSPSPIGGRMQRLGWQVHS